MEGSEEVIETVGDDYSQAFGEEAGEVGLDVGKAVEPEPKVDQAAVEVQPEVGLEPEPVVQEPAVELSASEQALRDTKAWGTRLSQENADLRRQLDELRQQGHPAEVDAEPQTVDLLAELALTDGERDLLESDPELGGIVGKMAAFLQKAITSAPAGNSQTVEHLTGLLDQMHFTNTLISGGFDSEGNYIEGHADGVKVAVSQEFRDYWAAKGVNIDTVTDPVQSIKMIGDYKESLVKKAVANHDASQRTAAENLNNMATGLTSGNGVDPGQRGDDDYHSAFAEEAAIGL